MLPENPDIKVVLMSASMDSQSMVAYFSRALEGAAPHLLDLESCRPHPLKVTYLDDIPFFEERLDRALHRALCGPAWPDPGFPADWNQEDMAELLAEFVLHLHDTRPPRAGRTYPSLRTLFLLALSVSLHPSSTPFGTSFIFAVSLYTPSVFPTCPPSLGLSGFSIARGKLGSTGRV